MHDAWRLIAAATSAEYRRFLDGLNDCATAQRAQLAGLLRRQADCGVGRRAAFERLRDPDEYRAVVPLCDYDDLAPALGAGRAADVLAEPVALWERTGGSSGSAKLIPYTASALDGFRCAVHPWLHDLAQSFPSLGRGYFAISPVLREPSTTQSGVPIGSHGDAVYFGSEIADAVADISLIPDQVDRVTEIADWQFFTLRHLLRAADLSFFSVWSPTFLTELLAVLPSRAEALMRELHDGGPGVAPDPTRADQVRRALVGEGPDMRLLWPQLQLVSAWTHGSSARFVPTLRRLFPHATLQGKGLLCTEGAVTVPLSAWSYPVLAVNSGFFEFLDDDGQSWLAHEVRLGQAYEVVMSVPGLYRYRNGDRVRVAGRAGDAPLLEFLGRGGLVSDLVGEKLSEAFVCGCLAGIAGFAMVAPSITPHPHYQLFVDSGDAALRDRVEDALGDNPQYAYARRLGQLGPLELIEVPRGLQCYQAAMLARGSRLGDIKAPSLRPEADWEARLRG